MKRTLKRSIAGAAGFASLVAVVLLGGAALAQSESSPLYDTDKSAEGGPIASPSPRRDGTGFVRSGGLQDAAPAGGALTPPPVAGPREAGFPRPLPVVDLRAAFGEAAGPQAPAIPGGRFAPTGAPRAAAEAANETVDRIADRHLNEARKAEADKRWEDVVREADAALRLQDDFAGRRMRAHGAAMLGKWELVAADEEAALGLIPKNADPTYADPSKVNADWAYSLAKLGRFTQARVAAERAVGIDPGNAHAHEVLAKIYSHLRRDDKSLRDKALAEIKLAAALDPKRYDVVARDAASTGRVESEFDNEAPDLISDIWAAKSELDSVRSYLGPEAFVTLGVLIVVALGWLGWILGKPPAPARAAAPPAPAAPIHANGLLAGKYETIRVIGRGGMGDVLEARDQSLGRTVAIKRMSTRIADVGAQGRELMLQEARTVAQLHHPAIVDVYGLIEEGDTLYLVFEFIRGKTVQQLLAESRRLSVERTLEILKPVCQALEFAHSRGVVHRDLKPSNIMVTEDGYPKLMDFGIARRMADKTPIQVEAPKPQGSFDYIHTRTIVGTPLYMAPEMEQGVVCKESDIYSLGICLYEMVTGERPFMEPATAFQKIQMDYLKPTLRVPQLPAAIDELISSALQASPESRMHTVKEFLERLKAVAKPAPKGRIA